MFHIWDADYQAFVKANQMHRTADDYAAVGLPPGCNPFRYAPGFMNLAREHPGTSAAENSLVWVATRVNYGRETEEAKKILTRDHFRSDKLAPIFASQVHSIGSETTGPLLRKALTENPHREVRGLACYWLARYQMERAEASRWARR